MNPEWIESLPKTPPETETEHHSEQELEREDTISTLDTYVLNNGDVVIDYICDDAKYIYGDEEDQVDEHINDNTTSEDPLYEIIDMENIINIGLNKEEIDTFHEKLYTYYVETRSSEKSCLDRYDMLCLMNNIWQKVLISREVDKNVMDLKEIVIEDVFEESIRYKPYIDEDGVWITPCFAPKKRVKLIRGEDTIYERVIPSASIFGSICTGLECEGSDMDITLPNSVDNPSIDIWFNKNEQKSKLSSFLSRFNEEITSNPEIAHKGYVFEVFPVLNAKVPIIKIRETKQSQLEMDIAIQSSQQSVATLINFYCDYDERVRPFIIAVKHWSKTRAICDAMNNYPNSFGFVLLCIKYLQMVNILPICSISDANPNDVIIVKATETERDKINKDTIMELMVQFFEMYHRFNFKLLQISTSRIGLESKICHDFYSNFKYNHQSTMVVEDPSCRSANVTRHVRPYRLSIMKNEFFRGYICCKNGDWNLLMSQYSNDIPFWWQKYPPLDDEQLFYYKKISKHDDDAHKTYKTFSKILSNKLNFMLTDEDIYIFLKLTPFKSIYININNLYDLDEFCIVCKFYIVQFNIQFIKKYHQDGIQQNCANDEKYKIFVQEMSNNSNNTNGNVVIMPNNLYQYIVGQYNCDDYHIYNHSYYNSFISLFSLWKCLFDENKNDIFANKEWIVSKIKHCMIAVGLTSMSQISLFKLLKHI